jgi:DNA-binding GntR family transcriptional regulator
MATITKEPPRARAIRLVREWIDANEFPAGSVLPPERTLSKRAGVGLSTMQRALQLLENEGLIERRRPRTRVVSLNVPNQPTAKLLSDTVALVSSTMEASTSHLTSGWGDNVPPGAVQALREDELNTLCLHSGKLTESVCETKIPSEAAKAKNEIPRTRNSRCA